VQLIDTVVITFVAWSGMMSTGKILNHHLRRTGSS